MRFNPTLILLGSQLVGFSIPKVLKPPKPATQISADTATVTDDVTAQGRRIFHGKGTCFACHGQNLQGGPVAPALLGPKWRNGDGSFHMILHVVRTGVPGTLMVSHPGGISDAETILVANYIYAVSRKLTKP